LNKKTEFDIWRRFQIPIVLAITIFLVFTLISVSLREQHPLRPLENIVITVTAPVFNFFRQTGAGISRVWRGYFYLVDVQAENEILKQKTSENQSK
jgi:hypothetical protein